MSTEVTEKTAKDLALEETGFSDYKELTFIFHGIDGSYGSIPAYDGRVYTFKVEEGSVDPTQLIKTPTTVSPVTGLQGVEIIYIANTI